jgi:hypothetical protein
MLEDGTDYMERGASGYSCRIFSLARKSKLFKIPAGRGQDSGIPKLSRDWRVEGESIVCEAA